MRGGDERTGELFSYVDLEARVRRDHPLRAIRTSVTEALFYSPRTPLMRPATQAYAGHSAKHFDEQR